MGLLHELARWSADFCVAGASLGLVYMAIASVLTLRFGRDRAQVDPAKPLPPVTILMPLCGDEAGLYARMRALCEQDYAAPVQLLCAIQDPEDPAIAAVERIAGDFPAGPCAMAYRSRPARAQSQDVEPDQCHAARAP